MRRVLLLFVVLPVLLYACVSTSPTPMQQAAIEETTEEKLPIDSLVTIGQLDNGLRYVIRKNQKPENRIELRLVVDAGSVLEDENQQGLAHFAEHMAFNGTKNFAKQELVDYLELIGMRFGPDLNAYTSFDETVYMLTVPTDSTEVVETASKSWKTGHIRSVLRPRKSTRNGASSSKSGGCGAVPSSAC